MGAMLAAAFVAVTGWRTRPPETLGDVRADVTEWYKEQEAYSEMARRTPGFVPDAEYEHSLTSRMAVLNQRYAAARDRDR